MVKLVKEIYFDILLIFYISGSVGILECMGKFGVDIVSVDWMVDMVDVC